MKDIQTRDERVEAGATAAPAPSPMIATGVMTRTRERARQELQQREAHPSLQAQPHQVFYTTRRTQLAEAAADEATETAYLLSPRYASEATVRELQQRPAVNFVVQNVVSPSSSNKKEDEVIHGEQTRVIAGPAAVKATPPAGHSKRQSWFSPVHVPLTHRKLVESPRIFGGIAPSKPLAARRASDLQNQSPARGLVPRVAMVQQSGTTQKRRRTVDRQFLDVLRAQNQELYNKIVRRFQEIRRIEQAPPDGSRMGPLAEKRQPGVVEEEELLSGISSVEDAVLFFLHEKHKHDIVYFKRRSDCHGSPPHAAVGDQLSLSLSFSATARQDAASRYLPYDLERVAASPEPGSGDFFIMSSTALVHHANNNHGDEFIGEAIPIAQWIMESKMFGLLLAGIPLFQKFLVRKVFVWWAMETRHLIFKDMKSRMSRSLPLARRSFAQPMLASFQALRRVQQVRALTLPTKHVASINLSSLHDHHRERLSEAETKLIDAKEELLSLMDTMVHDIQLDTDPSTQLDDLYSVEASEIHVVNPKWKSAPIRALRHRKESLSRQIETAKLDLSLLSKHVRLMEYMFTESVYLMLLGCVRHLTSELGVEANHGTISAAVAIVKDDLVLSPSVVEMKNVLLESIARLIRLAGNFHFTKNAVAWSTTRGTGSLALVASAFASDAVASQFDLQEVLRNDHEFKEVSSTLIEQVARCFDEAAHQMKAFESLKPIYAAVQSVSRAGTVRNLKESSNNLIGDAVVELPTVSGVSGSELARYLRSLAHRLAVLDRSQHACQKIQSSWKVGFLEIQCRRSVTEILDLITEEREMLHQHVFQLAAQGTGECLVAIHKASVVVEDRPQLIEYFCEQLKQVKTLKDGEKRLHQDIRNVDEVVRALKRYAPSLLAESSIQYNLLHAMYTKYGLLTQSHDKFVGKMLPNITQQVSTALQRYTVRCQRLLRIYEESAGIATEEELEKSVGSFQDIAREIRSIENATRLYQDYQRMVGMKVMEITMLGEAKQRWEEVHDVVTFTIQWKTATTIMESGIFSEQPWQTHYDKVTAFLSRILTLQQDRTKPFAAALLERLRGSILDYQRRLELVMEMAEPFVKPHHWQQILALLDIVNFVSASGVVLSDGSTLTLGFLQTRSLWKFEGHIREITLKARHDAVTESKVDEMKRRLYAAVLPIVKIGEAYELEATATLRIIAQFEHDLVSVQTLAQLASSAQLASDLAQWAEEISNYQDILDTWVAVQADWKQLALLFGHHDVQQIAVDATYEFLALERKWRAMMAAAKNVSLLTVCLRDVMSRAFLHNCAVTSEKLWKELGNYLWEKRHFFPRLHFVSDRDLLHIIASSKHPSRLCRLISKCFREIHCLRIARVDTATRQKPGSVAALDPEPSIERSVDDDKAVQLFAIEGVMGGSSGDELQIKPLRVTASPEIWMKDLSCRMSDAVKEALCLAIDGSLAGAYENHFAELYRSQLSVMESGSPTVATRYSSQSRSWIALPLHLIVLCMNVMLTNELTGLVFADRNGIEWTTFWDGFTVKKQNLTALIRRRDITKRERLVISNLLVLLMNKCSGIEDLQREETVASAAAVAATIAAQHHPDATAIHYNYANGSSFAWTKMMRFYYEPFEKKCVIHQSVKSYEFGYSFLGGYTCPVLTPLCDRVLLALNLAVSLEVGAVLHSRSSAQSVGKQTLLKELATSIGFELVAFDCSMAVGYAQFHRLLLGALQCESCWVVLRGVECRADLEAIRFIARELGRLRDVIHGGHDVFALDGITVNISSSRTGIFVSTSLDLHNSLPHQELMLRLSHTFMPVVCHPPEIVRIADVIFAAAGMKDGATLSRKLASLGKQFEHNPVRCLSAPMNLRQLVAAIKGAAAKHVANVWRSEEKCLVLSLWDEIGVNVIPEQRLVVMKIVRSMFPVAEKLQLSALGMLATRTTAGSSDTKQPPPAPSTVDDELAYDSDEDEKCKDLSRFRDHARHIMDASKHLVPTDQYIRKVIDLFQVTHRHLFTVLVGQSGCGKTTAIDILCNATANSQKEDATSDGSGSYPSVWENHTKTIRLFPSAFTFEDIYGRFKEDATWIDGFLTKFIKNLCVESTHLRASAAPPSATPTPSSSSSTTTPHTGHPTTTNLSWLVLDGLTDPCVIEPLRDFVSSDLSSTQRLQLPNGDQLHCESTMVRIFCEVAELHEWSPGTISRCGVLYFPTDLVPYTMLIKSWAKKTVATKPKHATLCTRIAKMARSMLPTLLDVCKRHVKMATIEILVPHLVSNFLQLLGWLIDQMPPELSSADGGDTKIVVVYAALLTLGLCVPEKGQAEFHDAAVALAPEIVSRLGHELATRGGKTIYDLSLKFENETLQLRLFDAPLPLLADGYSTWHRHGIRRKSTFRRMSDSYSTRGGGLVGLGTSPTLFVPTSRLLAYREWMATMLMAKLNVLVVGASATGKTRLLEDTLTELVKSERVDTKCVQIHRSVRGDHILNAVESGLPRKTRSLYCPGAGKRALVVVVENLNLETELQLPTGLVVRPCSEMLRQVCDAKGSFVTATNDFVEFRDVVLACSFSLSSYGYSRLPARLLRHFHVMWISDQTREVFRTILTTFPEQLVARLPENAQLQVSDVARVCRLPIEIFHAVRKHLKPTPRTPHLLLSLNDVLRCFSRLLNVSNKSTERFSDLEIYAVATTYQLYRTRMKDGAELTTLQAISISAAKKLGCSSVSLDAIRSPFKYLFTDYGDTEGCSRVTSRAAEALFVAADERFQWYNRSAAKDTSPSVDSPVTSGDFHKPMPMGISPLPLIRKTSNIGATPLAAALSDPGAPLASSTASDGDQEPNYSPNPRRASNLAMGSISAVEKSTALSPATIQNMLDVLTMLQSGARHLLFCGAEPSTRRSATMVACGAQAFHFREVASQLQFSEFIDQLKVPILEAGLKASHTLIYVDSDSLTQEERDVLVHIMLHADLPHTLYSSSDKAKILAQEHQMRAFQHAHLRRPSVSSFFDDLTTVTSTRDGMIALQDPRKDELQPSANQQKKSVYCENLRRSLCIVLSFGQSAKMYNLVTSHPTLYYHASVKTFRCFDRESLEAIYHDCLGDLVPLSETLTRVTVSADARHDLQALMVAIHEDAMVFLDPPIAADSGDVSSEHFGASRSRFEDLLGAFKALFLHQKAEMNDLQTSLASALQLIESDAREASNQLAQSADGRSQLVDAARTVAESSTRLQECEILDRDARRAFLLDEQRCSVLQSEIEQEREVIQHELDKTLPDVAKATDALNQINKYHITEMKSFVNPPQLVRLAMQAVCVLLGAPPTWTEALRILADIHFLDRLRNFDKHRVDISLIDRVKMYVNHPDFSMENMKRASIASTTLCKWVLAIVRYFEVMRQVAPTQHKLSETMQQFHQIDEMVQAERQKLIDLELHLNGLRAQHVQNVQREQELQRSYESKKRWKAEVVQFQHVVDQWLTVLQKRMAQIKACQFTLVGDCALAAATSTYLCAIPYERRHAAVHRWRGLAMQHLCGRPSSTSPVTPSMSMPHAHSYLRSWCLPHKSLLKEEFKRAVLTMELRNEAPLTVNMVLMDQMHRLRERFPVLIDPLGRAVAWLTQRCRASGAAAPPVVDHAHTESDDHTEGDDAAVTDPAMDDFVSSQLHQTPRHAAAVHAMRRFHILVVDACDPLAVSLVEKQITHKSPLLIVMDHVSDCDESTFHALVDVAAIATKKGDHAVIFATTSLDQMASWKPKIWSQLHVVDCSPPAVELDDHIVTSFLSHHWPALQSEFEVACSEYVAEKIKEDHAFTGFLACLEHIAHERDGVQQSFAKTGGVHAQRLNEIVGVISDQFPGNAGLQEHEMSRITRCLDEFVAVKRKRQLAKRCVVALGDTRRRFDAIAARVRALITAEERFFHRHGHVPWLRALQWDLSSIVAHVDACIRGQITTLNCHVEDGPDADRVHGSLANAIERITQSYLTKRLLGLPSEYHRAFRFLVTLAVATAQDSVDFAAVDLLLKPRVCDDPIEPLDGTTSEERAGDDGNAVMDRPGDLILTVATDAVHTIISTALHRLTGRDGCEPPSATLAIPQECRGIYARMDAIYFAAFPNVGGVEMDALRKTLARDMSTQPQSWIAYARSPTLGIASGRFRDGATDATSDGVPLWVANRTVLERFLLCTAVFGSMSVELVDAMAVWYLGRMAGAVTVTKNVMEAAYDLPGTDGSHHLPLIVHFNPQLQVSTPYASILHCARLAGVREELLVFLSMRTEGDVQRLRLLKDYHASGAWVVVQDFASARQSARNQLRLELQRLQDLLPTMANVSHDFRIWILHPVETAPLPSQIAETQPAQDQRSRAVRLGLDRARHVYLELPNGLDEYQRAFAVDHHLRKRLAEKLQQQQQSHLQDSLLPPGAKATSQMHIVPLSPPKRASARLATPSTSYPLASLPPQQMWIQAALWIFHTLFRSQASLGIPDGRRGLTCETRVLVPCDLRASHHELERAMRLIQLHQRQRAVASAMAVVSGGGGAASVSATSPSAEWTTLVELASEVYAGRISEPSLLALCRHLMAACLVPPHQQSRDLASGWSRGTEWHQRLLVARDLITQSDGSSGSIATDEVALMPHSLGWRRHVADWRDAVRGGSLEGDNNDDKSTAAAPAIAHQLLRQLPPKDCLTQGVQRQQHQRRTSVIAAWRKNKPATVMKDGPSSSPSTVHSVAIPERPGMSAPAWQRAVLEHVQQVELPAMEMYIRHIWESLEYVASAKPRHGSSLTNGPLCAALRRSQRPDAWRFVSVVSPFASPIVGSSSSPTDLCTQYATPRRLDKWVQWLHCAVELHHATASGMRLPDPLWLPALGYPTACLFAIRQTIALENSVSPDALVFAVMNPLQLRTQPWNELMDVLATLQVAGLVLWNAHWSSEKHHAFQKSATTAPTSQCGDLIDAPAVRPAILDSLPPLTIHVTTRASEAEPPLQTPPGVESHSYRCPIFRDATSMVHQEQAIDWLVIPSIDPANVMAACGVALFLQDDQ